MLAIERRRNILLEIQSEQSVLVTELSKKYGVTEETIRRDLDKLTQGGFVTKTYGGAIYNDGVNKDLPFKIRESSNKKEKLKIARHIYAQIKNDSTLMLDSSSTVLELGRLIRGLKRITVITNSVRMLAELSDYDNVNVISTGGTLRKSSLSLTGKTAVETIGNYHVDLAVISCKGVDLVRGISDSNEQETEVKRAMIKSANRFIVAADSTKLNKTAFIKFMDIADADRIVTCTSDEKWLSFAEESDKLVII